jgi:hypothetical protein
VSSYKERGGCGGLRDMAIGQVVEFPLLGDTGVIPTAAYRRF